MGSEASHRYPNPEWELFRQTAGPASTPDAGLSPCARPSLRALGADGPALHPVSGSGFGQNGDLIRHLGRKSSTESDLVLAGTVLRPCDW